MPNRWLVKTNPVYLSFADISTHRTVTWEGVTQPASLANLRAMRRGDDVLVYHSGHARAVVGLARVRKGAYPDPRDEEGRLSVVDLAAREPLGRPVTLLELREESTLEGWELVRIPRLHVMPVPAVAWRKILALAARQPRDRTG